MNDKNEKIQEAYDLLNDKFIIKYEDIAPIFNALTAIQARQIVIDFTAVKELHNKTTSK